MSSEIDAERRTMPRSSGSARGYRVTLIVGLIVASPVAYAKEKWAKLTLSPETGEEVAAKERDVIPHSHGFDGSGWSWTAGVGYEIPLTERFGLAPIADYAAGSLGDVRNLLVVETGRRYSVVEFKVAIVRHFGRPKEAR
jgi:hypothetical protein